MAAEHASVETRSLLVLVPTGHQRARASGGYPYLSFEKILFRATGGTARLGNQTVSHSE